ncbi:unnamed protein product, partial [Musa hybrid cultivar]
LVAFQRGILPFSDRGERGEKWRMGHRNGVSMSRCGCWPRQKRFSPSMELRQKPSRRSDLDWTWNRSIGGSRTDEVRSLVHTNS